VSEPEHLSKEIQHLVDNLIPQARAEAWRTFNSARHATNRDELESIAYLGLMQAANRWYRYCLAKGFDPGCGEVPCERPETCGTRYFGAYALRRMKGAILDSQRSADWVPRAVRQHAKALREAGEDTGVTEEQLAHRTGLDKETIRATRSAVAQRPVSINDDSGRDVAEPAGTESLVAASQILASVVAAMRTLPVLSQVILAMRHFEQRELKDCAEILGVKESIVSQLHQESVIAVHQAMAEAAREAP
jgi:RNA polymerase sigma factor for flagellar operon FliA